MRKSWCSPTWHLRLDFISGRCWPQSVAPTCVSPKARTKHILIEIGVHNPVLKTEIMTSFKTKSARIITICLDFMEGSLKFWVNDKRYSNKTMRLVPLGGPWIPCIKIGMENNCVSLNPFAREPSSFFEQKRARHAKLESLMMPLIQNSICVANLPDIDAQTEEETGKVLNQLFQTSSAVISSIAMSDPSQLYPLKAREGTSQAKEALSRNFCYIRFHHYIYMVEFLDKHKPQTKFQIYEANTIMDWMKKPVGELSESEQMFVDLIKKAIGAPEATQDETVGAIRAASEALENLESRQQENQPKKQTFPNDSDENLVEITHQPFSDKILISKGRSGKVKAVSRDLSSGQFNLQEIDMTDEPSSYKSKVRLRTNKVEFLRLIKQVHWQTIFEDIENVKGSEKKYLDRVMHGLLADFFKSLQEARMEMTESGPRSENIIFNVSLYSAKVCFDVMFHQTRAQIVAIAKIIEQYAPVNLASSEALKKFKDLPVSEEMRQKLGFGTDQASIDELESYLSLLTDLQEQLWAKARSDQCPQEIKQILTNISRPYSALNRLGSFISWPFCRYPRELRGPDQTTESLSVDMSPLRLSDNGLYLRASDQLSMYDNDTLELDCLSAGATNSGSLKQVTEQIGQQHKMLKGFPSRNIPLSRSLNYLSPQKFISVTEVISSVNSNYVLVGGQNGSISICSSILTLTPLKAMQFFTHDVDKKLAKSIEVLQKLESRYKTCMKFQESICKKDAQIPWFVELDAQSAPNSKKVKKGKSTTKDKGLKKKKSSAAKKAAKKGKKKVSQSEVSNQELDEAKTPAKPSEQTNTNAPEGEIINIDTAFETDESAPLSKKEVPREINLKPAREPKRASQQPERPRVESTQVEVLGYILLTKQRTQSLCPLSVGCIYRNTLNGKFYLKVRKLMIQIQQYLLYFNSDSHSSGTQINLLDGTQKLQEPLTMDTFQDILKHQETLLELYPVFMRNQVLKKQYPRWESKFQTLQEVDESELELEGVTQVLDFTEVAHSIENQSHIHIVCKNQDNQTEVRQVYVDQTYPKAERYIGKIDLVETEILRLQQQPLRVFQVEEQVILLKSNAIEKYSLDRLDFIESQNVADVLTLESAKKAIVSNETVKSQLYCAKNVNKFRTEIPKQDWVICIPSSGKEEIQKLHLTQAQELKRDSQISIRDVIQKAPASDLKSIPEVLIGSSAGVKIENYPDDFKLYQHLLDREGSHFTRAHFHRLSSSHDKGIQQFDFRVSLSDDSQQQQLRLAKGIHVELSFTKPTDSPIDMNLDCSQSLKQDGDWSNLNNKLMRIPLAVQHFVGSQIGDQLFPSVLVTPDKTVFVSNYPQPKYIFRHLESKPFVPTQVTIWSKNCKESADGFPIGQGLVFISDSLPAIMDKNINKKFYQMTKEEFGEWQRWRQENLRGEPLKPNEPVAFFDFKDQDTIDIDLRFRRSCKYVKLVPTAFRSQPINYADTKQFDKYQAECQFFGVSGYEVESLIYEGPESRTVGNHLFHPELNIPVTLSVSAEEDEASKREISEVDSVCISQVRSLNNQDGGLMPSTILNQDSGMKRLIGSGQQTFDLEGKDMKAQTFCISVKQDIDDCLNTAKWELSGISIQVETFKDVEQTFLSTDLNVRKGDIRECLLDIAGEKAGSENSIDTVCLPILEIINDYDNPQHGKDLIHAVTCLTHLIADPYLLPINQRIRVLELIKDNLQIQNLLEPQRFINVYTPRLQKYIINLIELVGLRREKVVREQTDKLLEYTFERLSISGFMDDDKSSSSPHKLSLFPLDVLKNILNMVPRRRSRQIVQKFLTIFDEDMSMLMKTQPLYFQLRSQLEFNSFPFDMDYLALKECNQSTSSYQLGVQGVEGYQLLQSDFQFIKIGTTYLLKTQLRHRSEVSQIKLVFQSDLKSIQKFKITILAHNETPNSGSELVLVQNFDESTFTQMCEKANRSSTSSYFSHTTHYDQYNEIQVKDYHLDLFGSIQPSYLHPFTKEPLTIVPYLNVISFDLPQSCGKQFCQKFEIQIELLDSYRKIAKACPTSQVLITPEFYGFAVVPETSDSKTPNIDLTDEFLNLNLSVPICRAEEDNFLPSLEGYSEQQAINHATINGVNYDVIDVSASGGVNEQKNIQNNKLFRMNIEKTQAASSMKDFDLLPKIKSEREEEAGSGFQNEEVVSLANLPMPNPPPFPGGFGQPSSSFGGFGGLPMNQTPPFSPQASALVNPLVSPTPLFVQKNDDISGFGKEHEESKQIDESIATMKNVGNNDQELENRFKRKATVLEERQEELKTLLGDEAYCKKVLDKDTQECKKFKKLLSQIGKAKIELRERRADLPVDQQFIASRQGQGSGFTEVFKSELDYNFIVSQASKGYNSSLKYAYAFAEVACTYLDEVYQKDQKCIKDPIALFRQLFKTFILSDKVGAHPIVENLMHNLYLFGVPEDKKIAFQVSLIQDVMIKREHQMNLNNFIRFVQSDRFDFISVNELVDEYIELFKCEPSSPLRMVEHQGNATQLLNQSTGRGKKSDSMSPNKILAALSYLCEHLNYRDRLQTNYPLESDMLLYCPKVLDPVSQNLLFRLVADHIMCCKNLHSGSIKPKSSAFLLYFTQIYLKIAKDGIIDIDELVNEGDFLIILMAVVQSGSEQIQNNFTDALILLMQNSSQEKRTIVINLFNYGLTYLQSTEDSLQGKVYHLAERNTGSGFALLFSHFQIIFKLLSKILEEADQKKEEQVQSKDVKRQLSIKFAMQIDFANKKLEEFIMTLLDGLKISDRVQNSRAFDRSNSLAEVILAQRPTNNISIRLLVEINNSIPMIKDTRIKDKIISGNVRFFKQLSHLDKEKFVDRIIEQFERITFVKESHSQNTTIVLQLLASLLGCQDQKHDSKWRELQQPTESVVNEHDKLEVTILMSFCHKLMNILLTGKASERLAKRNEIEKRKKILKTAKSTLDLEQLTSLLNTLSCFLKTRCNIHTVKGAAGLSTTMVQYLRLANKICQVILYSGCPGDNQQESGTKRQALLSLKLSDNPEATLKETSIYSLIDFWCLNQTDIVQDIPTQKCHQLNRKIKSILLTTARGSTDNLKVCLPTLLEVITRYDVELPILCKNEEINHMRAVCLQENINAVFQRLIKGWFSQITDEEERSLVAYEYLSKCDGLNFFLQRLKNQQKMSLYNYMMPELSTEGGLTSKPQNSVSWKFSHLFVSQQDEQSSDEEEDDKEFDKDILKYVGKKIGMKLTKGDQISASLILKKNDTELVQAPKITALLRRQTATYNRSPTKDLSGPNSPFNRLGKKSLSGAAGSDKASLEVLKNLTERNYSMQLRLLDTSLSQIDTNQYTGTLWNQIKAKNVIAATIVLDGDLNDSAQNKFRQGQWETPQTIEAEVPSDKDAARNEFYLVFDLGEVAQLSESQITFSLDGGPPNMHGGFGGGYHGNSNNDAVIPQLVIMEGKKDSPFSKPQADDNQLNQRPSSLYNDAPDWSEVLYKIEDRKDIQDNLVTFAHSHCKNVVTKREVSRNDVKLELSSQLKEVGRKECRYLRIRMLYKDESSFLQEEQKSQNPSGQATQTAQSVKKKCFVINRIQLLGCQPKTTQQMNDLLLYLQRQSSVQVFQEFFSLNKGSIYNKIANDRSLLETLKKSYEDILPFIVYQPKAFIPTLIGLARESNEFCDDIVKQKILCTVFSSPKGKSELDRDQVTSGVKMELLEGLIRTHNTKRGEIFQRILNFLLQQCDIMGLGPNDKDDMNQIDYNMKIASIFTQCALQISSEASYMKSQLGSKSLLQFDERKHQRQQTSLTPIELNYTTEDVKNIIVFGRLLSDPSQQKAVIALVMLLLRLPQPFTNVSENPLDIENIIRDELLGDEPSFDLEQVQSQVFGFEILSLMSRTNPEHVKSAVDWSMISQIVEQLKEFKIVQSKTKLTQAELAYKGLSKNKAPNPLSLELKVQPAQAIRLLQIVYNFVSSGLLIETEEQRLNLAIDLYSMLQPLYNDEDPEEVGVRTSERTNLTCSDLLPPDLIEAIISTLKLVINKQESLQQMLAKKLQKDLMLIDRLSSGTSQRSKFVQLVAEKLLKFQNSIPVMVNKIHDQNKVSPIYKGVDGSGSGSSCLKSALMNKKFLDLFYELLIRQKNEKSQKKNLKKLSHKDHWQNLASLSQNEMSFSNYQKIVGLLQGQQNLLWIFDVTVGDQELTVAYFAFAQINNLPEGDNDYQKLKTQFAPGDFLMVGHKDQSDMLCMQTGLPNQQNYGGGLFGGPDLNTQQHFSLNFNQNQPFQFGDPHIKKQENGSIIIGQTLGINFITLKFGKQPQGPQYHNFGYNHNGNVNTQFFQYFKKEYPNQFKKLSEHDMHNHSESKVRKVEIWTWNPSQGGLTDAQKGPIDASLQEFVPDILVDQSKQIVKQNPLYQQMAPENILTQNLVFDVPLTMPIEKIKQELKVYGSFVRCESLKPGLQILTKVEKEISRAILLKDLIPNESSSVMLYSSDQIAISSLSKTSSIKSASDGKEESSEAFIPIQNLPLLHKFTVNNGMQALIASAMQKLGPVKDQNDIAELWFDFLTMYQDTFAPLPGFESAFFDGQRVDVLLKIICMEFKVQNKPKDKKEEEAKKQADSSSKAGKQPPLTPTITIKPATMSQNFKLDLDEGNDDVSDKLEIISYGEEFDNGGPNLEAGYVTKPKSKMKKRDKKNASTEQKSPEYQQQLELSEAMKQHAYKVCKELMAKETEQMKAGSGAQQGSFTKTCIERGLFIAVIDILGDLTGEQRRQKVIRNVTEVREEEDWDEIEELEVMQPIMQSIVADVSKPDLFGQPSTGGGLFGTAQPIFGGTLQDKPGGAKPKGVGYSTGVGQTWDVNAYLKTKQAKNAQVIRIIDIIGALVSSCRDGDQEDGQCPLSDEDEAKIKEMFLCSALLPSLESALRTASILEMAKELNLFLAYLNLIESLASKQNLFSLLMDIEKEYEPSQRESVSALLKNAANMAEIFLQCLDPEDTPEPTTLKKTKSTLDEESKQAQDPKSLSERLVAVNTIVNDKIQTELANKGSKSLAQIMSMPMAEAYTELLSKLRVQRHSLRKDGKLENPLDHHYASNEKSAATTQPKKLVRLAQEIADMTNSLPCEPTNAIFCVVDKQRVDYMKAIIMGAQGTPYAHGAFVYDIYFDDKYPDCSPKVNLSTTGGGKIRFNPNLYHCGKVCLSLLGTWRGSATENWNPKVSTLLQVLLSIQAIIMSNEVYYNEPGFEHEMGTPQGDKNNNGYSNIVRYGTLKYAILEQIRNPAQGFEEIIRMNFFLKKETILAEVDEWISMAKTQEASYSGLTSGHNHTICNMFQNDANKYYQELVSMRAELVTEFEKLNSPWVSKDPDTNKIINLEQLEDKVNPQNTAAGGTEKMLEHLQTSEQTEIDKIDMSYKAEEKAIDAKEINIQDGEVKDRWSRYIGAMGIEAVAKQAESSIFLSGLGGLGVEIAKNIVLAGCKQLIIHDTCKPNYFDLQSQFFLSEADVQDGTKTRAEACKAKLQELNSYVRVTILEAKAIPPDFFTKNLFGIKTAVITDCFGQGYTNSIIKSWNDNCRSIGIQMIVADQIGLFSRILTDFGPCHKVIDKNGEELQQVMLSSIEAATFKNEDQSPQPGAKVTLIEHANHDFEEGNLITLSEVKGMLLKEDACCSINGADFTVKDVINRNSFIIDCDTSRYSAYEVNGVAKQVKTSTVVEFSPLSEVLDDFSGKYFDQDLINMDFEKMDNFRHSNICFKAFGKKLGGKGNPLTDKNLSTQIKDMDENERKAFQKLRDAFINTKEASFGPLCAFIGGVVAQEIVKGITQKFMPIKQEFYFDLMELYQPLTGFGVDQTNRHCSLVKCFGEPFVDAIKNAKVFMIGAGAIGCELLKNFAMLGLGSDGNGQITLTDPDIIELSNLNRQFLFREKHLRKPKSVTAAAAAIAMNPSLYGRIQARLDKIHKDTEKIYSELFYKQQTVVANALDNVAARLFIDAQCVKARVPLLDSGTLGPKGHVQVVIPFQTESYGSTQDPEENNQIPHCTLKMFPEETLHCVEWAKDLFGTFYTLTPQNFNKLKSAPIHEVGFDQFSEAKNINKAIKLAEQRPTDFTSCIVRARHKFHKLFHNDILQLLHVYPIDKTTKEGRPFWSLPKRPPKNQPFEPSNDTHRDFIAAYACLQAKMYGIEIPYEDPRSDYAKTQMAKIAVYVNVKEFRPNDAKAKEIESQVDKQNQGSEDQQEPEQQEEVKVIDTTVSPQQQKQQIEANFISKVQSDSMPLLNVEEFEKDDDKNFHIDFIYAAANVRALNYSLDKMDWITVKLKAGRIVPALATTTAAIAGLQTIELLKLLKRSSSGQDKPFPVEKFRNSFLNLALPLLTMSEVGPPVKNTIRKGLTVNEWVRWEIMISESTTLGSIVSNLERQFKLQARDVIYDLSLIFSYALRETGISLQKQPQMKQPVLQLLKETIEPEQYDMIAEKGFIDLTITFIDPEQAQTEEAKESGGQEVILQNIPTVRAILKPKDIAKK